MARTTMKRQELADQIVKKLRKASKALTQRWKAGEKIRYFYLDDLLDPKVVKSIFAAFPDYRDMVLKKSLREQKYVAAQMDRYHPLLEEAIYAFQDPRVVKLISDITGLPKLEPDENLYAGGISLMRQGDFLNPHLDNSHDKDRLRYRALNLLYYVTPDWPADRGGNLEIWPKGLQKSPTEIWSKFNRLVVMETNQHSWHSVNPVLHDGFRCCVSNYYFSSHAPGGVDYFHVTSFRARPGQVLRDLLLRLDISARMAIRKFFPKGIRENPHVYKR